MQFTQGAHVLTGVDFMIRNVFACIASGGSSSRSFVVRAAARGMAAHVQQPLVPSARADVPSATGAVPLVRTDAPRRFANDNAEPTVLTGWEEWMHGPEHRQTCGRQRMCGGKLLIGPVDYAVHVP